MGENFCLEWGEHNAQFFRTAEKLKKADALTDVVLTCEGGTPYQTHFYSAHKLILASCSGYFARVFNNKNLPNLTTSQSVVYLKGVEPKHMELLLNYMYRGTITCTEKELPGLLEAARGLQVRGLSNHGVEEPKEQQTPLRKKKKRKLSDDFLIKKDQETEEGGEQQQEEGEAEEEEDDENGENEKPKNKKKAKIEQEEEEEAEDLDGTVEDYGGEDAPNEDYELEYEDPNATGDNVLNPKQCPDCMKIFFSRQVMKRHYRSVHKKETPFACWECTYATSRKTVLCDHMVKTHGLKKEDFKKKVDEIYQFIKVEGGTRREWVMVQNP